MLKLIGLLLISLMAGSWALADAKPNPDLGSESPKASPRPIQDPDHWMAIVGDSGVTGAASDPSLSANFFTLIGRMGAIGLREGLSIHAAPAAESMTRVLYSKREYDEAVAGDQLSQLKKVAIGSAALDTLENTFGHTLGQRLGIVPNDVVLVAQDGTRVRSIPQQIERIYEMDTATLPPLVVMSYTANDFCDPGVFTDSVADRRARFKKSLDDAWGNARPLLKAHRRGTEFVVLAPLEVANVLTNPGILAQEVPLGIYGTVTCREMRSRDVENAPIASAIAGALTVMCPSVLGTSPGEVEKLQRLRDVQDVFNTVWKEKIAELNRAYADQGLRWVYVESVRHLEFTTGDVSNECFHPSASGHAKIADEILKLIDAKSLAKSS